MSVLQTGHHRWLGKILSFRFSYGLERPWYWHRDIEYQNTLLIKDECNIYAKIKIPLYKS